MLSCKISSKFCHFYEGPMESYKIHYAWEYFLLQDPVHDELVRECDMPWIQLWPKLHHMSSLLFFWATEVLKEMFVNTSMSSCPLTTARPESGEASTSLASSHVDADRGSPTVGGHCASVPSVSGVNHCASVPSVSGVKGGFNLALLYRIVGQGTHV